MVMTGGWFILILLTLARVPHRSISIALGQSQPLHFYSIWQGLVNVPIEHHPTIGDVISNRYLKVMFKIPKKGHLPTPVWCGAIWYSTVVGFLGYFPTSSECELWDAGIPLPTSGNLVETARFSSNAAIQVIVGICWKIARCSIHPLFRHWGWWRVSLALLMWCEPGWISNQQGFQ